MPFELLDIILVALMLVSGFLAMVRGFSRELLSISSWIIAGLATFTFYEVFTPLAAEYTISVTSNELAPKIVSGAIVFLISLILVSLVTMKIADFIVDSRIGPLDRTLGFVFGAARGALLVIVLLMFFINFFPDNQPQWIVNAKSRSMLQSMGEGLINSLPDDPGNYLMEKVGLGDDKQTGEPEN